MKKGIHGRKMLMTALRDHVANGALHAGRIGMKVGGDQRVERFCHLAVHALRMHKYGLDRVFEVERAEKVALDADCVVNSV